MLLRFLISSTLIVLVSCRSGYQYQKLKNVTELIESEGYPVMTYTVETEDGYLLDLIRIPHGMKDQNAPNYYNNKNNQESNESSNGDSISSSEENTEKLRPVILLMHNMLSSSEDFVIGGASKSLAFLMADNGFDVFLGNTRGSTYGRRHTVLDPERDPAFWKFCWHEMGTRDLPAIIDRMLMETRQDKLYYMGHMQGSTIFYVMASEKPEYNDKIRSMISLGPLAFMGHSTNLLLKLVSENRRTKGWVIRNLGEFELKPSNELLTNGGASDCLQRQKKQEMCRNIFFLWNGYNSDHMDDDMFNKIKRRVPAGGSTKELLHYAQLLESGRFAKYKNNENEDVDYDLGNIRVPVTLYYAPNDRLSEMSDVDKLGKKLPNLRQQVRVDDFTNNLDFVYGSNVRELYNNVIKVIQNMNNSRTRNQN